MFTGPHPSDLHTLTQPARLPRVSQSPTRPVVFPSAPADLVQSLEIAPAAYPDPIPGILPFGTVSVFAGAPGAGKTTMLAAWFRRWQLNKTICGYATNMPTGFYYLAGDRGGNAARRIFLEAGVTDLHFYSPMEDDTFDQAVLLNHRVALDVLRLAIKRMNPTPGSFLVIDPAAPFYVPGSPNDPRAVAAMLWALHVLARELQITILVIGHFAKQPADAQQRYRRPQDRIAGSLCWSGFSDTQIYLVDPEPPGQDYHVLGWTPRQSAPEEFKFRREGAGFVPHKSLEGVGTQTPVGESAYQLMRLVPDTGIQTAQLITTALETLTISRPTVFRHLKELEALGAITRPHGWVRRVALERVAPAPSIES